MALSPWRAAEATSRWTGTQGVGSELSQEEGVCASKAEVRDRPSGVRAPGARTWAGGYERAGGALTRGDRGTSGDALGGPGGQGLGPSSSTPLLLCPAPFPAGNIGMPATARL